MIQKIFKEQQNKEEEKTTQIIKIMKELYPFLNNVYDGLIINLLNFDKNGNPSIGKFSKRLLSEFLILLEPSFLTDKKIYPIANFNEQEAQELLQKLIKKISDMKTRFKELYSKYLEDIKNKLVKEDKRLTTEQNACILAFIQLLEENNMKYKEEESRIIGLDTNKIDCDLVSELFVEFADSVGLNFELIYLVRTGLPFPTHAAIIAKNRLEEEYIIEATVFLLDLKREKKLDESIIELENYKGFEKYTKKIPSNFDYIYGIKKFMEEEKKLERFGPKEMEKYISERVNEIKQNIELIFDPIQAYYYLYLADIYLIFAEDEVLKTELQSIKEKAKLYLKSNEKD